MRIVLSVFMLLLPLVALSQKPKLEMSQELGENMSFDKILLLSNGNTFAFDSYDAKLTVSLFDKKRAQVLHKKAIQSKFLDKASYFNHGSLRGLYEIGGQPTLFLNISVSTTPTLIMMIFDANSGNLVSETKIAELSSFKQRDVVKMKYDRPEQINFFVEKDPSADNYAVILYNGTSSDPMQRLAAQFYNGQHRKLNEINYYSPDVDYKHLRFVSATLDGTNLYICTYGSKSASKEENPHLILSKAAASQQKFTHKLLNFSSDFKETSGALKMNKGTGMLELLSLTLLSEKENMLTHKTRSYYAVLLSYIDAQSLTEIFTREINSEKLQAYKFKGLPQDFVINSDNSTTLLFEEGQYGVYYNGGVSDLGNIGIVNVDMKGNEVGGHVIAKKQSWGGDIEPFHLHTKREGQKHLYESAQAPFGTNEISSYDYLNVNNDRYFIYNEYPSNVTKDPKSLDNVDDISKTRLLLRNANGAHTFLFEDPFGKNGNVGGMINTSTYNADLKTYAILLYRFKGKNRIAYMGWVSFN